MTISIDFVDPLVTDMTLDESFSIQAEDDDVALTSINTAFVTLLGTMGADTTFAGNGRAAKTDGALISVTSDGTLTDVVLTGWDGTDPVALTNFDTLLGDPTSGLSTGLFTTAGDAIYLFNDIDNTISGDGTFVDDVIFGVDANGAIAFAILKEDTVVSSSETQLTFSMLTFTAIQDDLTTPDDPDNTINLDDLIALTASETSGFDFTGAPANKVMFLLGGALSGPGGLLVTPTSAIVQLNTSKNDPAAFALFNQNLDPGETLAFTFIESGNDPFRTIPELDHGEAILESNITFSTLATETEAEFKIAQQVGPSQISVLLTAWDTNKAAEDPSDGFFSDWVDDQTVDIIAVTVRKFGGGLAEFTQAGGGSDARISVNFSPTEPDGSYPGTYTLAHAVVVSGLEEGDVVMYTTAAGHERAFVKMLSGKGDIGNFSTSQEGSFSDNIDIFKIDDAGPTVDVTTDVDAGDIEALFKNLDETIDPDGDNSPAEGQDNYNPPETESSGGAGATTNGDLDDVLSGGTINTPIWQFNPSSDDAIGRLETGNGLLAALFGDPTTFVNFDTDGSGGVNPSAGRTDTLSWVLPAPVVTNLIATPVPGSGIEGLNDTARTIWLVKISDTVVEGRIAGADGVEADPANFDGDEVVILRFTITNPNVPANATIVDEQFAPVVHTDPNLYDEETPLLLTGSDELAIRYTTTVGDGDDDSESDFEDVTLISSGGTIASIDDDGPGADPLAPVPIEEDDLDNATVSGGAIVSGSDGLNEDGSTDAHKSPLGGEDLIAQLTASTDGPVTVAISTDATDLTDLATALGLQSQGEDVVFDVIFDDKGDGPGANDEQILIGYVEDGTTSGSFQELEDRKVLSWSLVLATGVATLELCDQIDHDDNVLRAEDDVNPADLDDNDQEEQELLTFTNIVVATSGDDIITLPSNFVQYLVQDDMSDIGDNGANAVPDGTEDLIPNGVIDFDAGSTIDVTLQAYLGSDEGGSAGVTITNYDNQIVYGSEPTPDLRLIAVPDDASNTKVVGYFLDEDNSGTITAGETTEFFRMSVNDGDPDSTNWTYTWEAFETPPPVEEPVDFNAIKSGGKQEILSPPVGAGNLVVDFDGLLFDDSQFDDTIPNDWAPETSPHILDPAGDQSSSDGVDDRGLTDDQDDGNPDAEGFGIKAGQASQFNHNEGFYAVLRDTKGTASTADDTFEKMSSLSFAVEGIGQAGIEYHIDWQIIDGGSVVDSDTDTRLTLPGNNEDPFDLIRLADGSAFDAVYVHVWLGEGVENKGIRLLDFSVGVPQPTDDKTQSWEFTIRDFEGDTDVGTALTGIDGTLDNDDDVVAGVGTVGVVDTTI